MQQKKKRKETSSKTEKDTSSKTGTLERSDYADWHFSEDLQDASDSRKTAVINNEPVTLNVDIATLNETRLADSGVLTEKYYTIYWQDHRGTAQESTQGTEWTLQ